MLQRLLTFIRASVIRFAGRLPFKIPLLKPIIRRIGQCFSKGEGVIQRGVRKGLRFDATHCNPGYLAGTKAPDEQRLLASLSRRGDVFYDIGAHAGFYAVIGARCVGPQGRVYAFEPTPELADRIRHNAYINNFEHIRVIEAAVCDKNQIIEFGSQGFNLTNSINKVGKTNSIQVEAVRLDTWITGEQPPDLIMMDIEGAELEALLGASNTIERYRPILMVEVHWFGQRFVYFIEEMLRPLRYEVTTYGGDPLPEMRPCHYHALLLPIERTN